MLKLYDYFRSSACFRVRIALNLKKLDFELNPIHLVNNGGEQHTTNYQAFNPQALVPTLLHDNQVLTQSLAIIEYLDELHPNPPLLPQNPLTKAQVRAFALSIAADIHPLNNLRVLQYLTDDLKIAADDKTKWYKHWVQKGLNALEKQLTSHHSTYSFCFGEEPTLAEICLVPQMYNARRFDCDLSFCPNLVRIDTLCQQLPAFKKAWPNEA
jgi:maleylpyruvate isomerase